MRDKDSDEVKKLLEQLGFEVDSVLDAKVEKRPDLLATRGDPTMFVEVKSRVQDSVLRAEMEAVPVGATGSIWTRDRILEKASGCPDRTAFQRRYPGAYDVAMRMRMLPEIHKMIPRRYKKALWTEERLEKEAQKHSRRGEFKKKSPSAYVMAGRKGIREKICRHMCTA